MESDNTMFSNRKILSAATAGRPATCQLKSTNRLVAGSKHAPGHHHRLRFAQPL